MTQKLIAPRTSRIAEDSLLKEVDEYFACGIKVSPGETVLDVGANIGAFALRVAERCRGDVRLVCFEPIPATYGALARNFQTNEWLKKTRHMLFPLGLSSPANAGRPLAFYNFAHFATNSTCDVAGKRREFEIFFEDRCRRLTAKLGRFAALGHLLQALAESPAWHAVLWWTLSRWMGIEVVTVPMATLGHMLKRHQIAGVDLLKIDVEGAELDVLLGLDAETWPRVRQVVMETHNRDGRQDKIARLLAENGLRQIAVTQQRTLDNGLDSVILTARRAGAGPA